MVFNRKKKYQVYLLNTTIKINPLRKYKIEIRNKKRRGFNAFSQS